MACKTCGKGKPKEKPKTVNTKNIKDIVKQIKEQRNIPEGKCGFCD
jgi:hypothetical protein